ncbi:MAG: class I SAM-dependent methyltransferase [Paracoccaceae bacterium]|nr:class I SAM-dependent methyltransferase [Paracoccaceae bacterium]
MADFEDLIWHDDRMVLDGWTFRLEHTPGDNWPESIEYFRLFKTRDVIDQYHRFWRAHGALAPEFHPLHVLELGIWDGASAALWAELLAPERLVAVDLARRNDSAYFEKFRRTRGHGARLVTRWATDQSDRTALGEIFNRDLGGRLDMVIDDASHDLSATKASFEILFPLLAPGGLYFIEDWSWPHWYNFQSAEHPWSNRAPLSRLAETLMRAAGSMPDDGPKMITSLFVQRDVLAVERGTRQVGAPAEFRLKDYALIRPQDR